MLRALYNALDAERQRRGLSWRQAMREINIGVETASGRHPIAQSTVTGLRTKRVAEGDGVLQMLRWLDRAPESFVDGIDITSAHQLPAAPPDRTLRFDAPKLHAALDAQRVARGLTWRRVAAEIGGTSASGLMNLKTASRVGFPIVVRMAHWLGRPLADFVRITLL